MESRQSFFNGRALFWGFGISLLMRNTNTNFWIAELLGTAIGLIILLLVKRTNESKIVKMLSGFSIAFLAATILVNMGGTLYLRETPTWILALFLLLGCFIIAKSKEYSLKRTLFLLFCYSIFMIVLGSIFLTKEAGMENIYPLFYFDYKGILYGALLYVLTSVTPILALNDIKDKKAVVSNYLMSSLSVIVISLLIMLVLGNKEAMLYRYPEYVLLKRIKISEFFSNVDNIFVVPMVVDLLVTISTGIRNFSVNGKYVQYILPVCLFFLVSYVSHNGFVMVALYYYFPILLGILLFLTLIPKKKQYKK